MAAVRYKKEYQEQVYRLCLLGATDKVISDFFHITPLQLTKWRKAHITFDQAIQEGKVQADSKVAQSLYKRACGYDAPDEKVFQYEGEPISVPTFKHYPPDVKAAIFWLTNRAPEQWKNTPAEETNVKPKSLFKVIINKGEHSA
jgi:hypothetical protein